MQTITDREARKELWNKLSKEQQAEVKKHTAAGADYDTALTRVSGVKVAVSSKGDRAPDSDPKPAAPLAKADPKRKDEEEGGGGKKRKKRIERLIEAMDEHLDEDEYDDFAEAGYRAWLANLSDGELAERYQRVIKEPEEANDLVKQALAGRLNDGDRAPGKLLEEIEEGKWELVRVEKDEDGDDDE